MPHVVQRALIVAVLTAIVSAAAPRTLSLASPSDGPSGAAGLAVAQTEQEAAGVLQTDDDGPMVIVPLHDDSLLYRTLPFTPVTAELTTEDGASYEGGGFSGADGWAEIGFLPPADAIQPGDTILLTRTGSDPVRVDVPALAATVDVAGNRILGTGPANTSVELVVRLRTGQPEIEQTVSVDDAGSWSLALPAQANLQPGAASGTVRLDDGPRRFEAAFADLSARATLGASRLSGRATPGSMITVAVERPGTPVVAVGPFEVTGSPGFTLPGALDVPLGAGDHVTITMASPAVPDAPDVSRSGRLPDITVSIDPADDLVGGTAPASTTLSVEADGLSGGVASFTAMADADGNWMVDAGEDGVDLAAGWRVQASLPVEPGLHAVGLAVIEQALIGVGIPTVEGRAMPGRPVTFTLRSDTGEIRRMATARADDQGDYTAAFDSPFNPAAVVPRAGDRVEVAYVRDDPLVMAVPTLTAIAEPDADRVAGRTDGGATVSVTIDSDVERPTATAAAAPDGTYVAEWSDLDLAAPAHGTASVLHSSGNRFFTTWAAVRLASMLGSDLVQSLVTGNGAPGRPVHVTLKDPEGRVIAEGASPVFQGTVGIPGLTGQGPQFFVQLSDATGAPVDMRPGDRLEVTVGDAEIEAEVPPLDAVVIVQTDTITGQTAPGAEVTIRLSQRPPSIGATARVTADEAGNWAHSFGDDVDLLFGDQFQLIARTGGHDFMQIVLAPGLLLDADQSALVTSLTPDTPVQVAVQRAGRSLSQSTGRTGDDGTLELLLVDAEGRPLELRAGDVITAVPLAGDAGVLRLEVPELMLEWNEERDTIGGRAGEGALTLLALNAYPRGGTLGVAQAWPGIMPDGTFDARFVPAPDVRPGTRLIAVHRPPSGHYVVRQRVVPILNAEVEGPSACGFGEPRGTIDGDLVNPDGSAAADMEATARFDGYFATTWRDPDDRVVAATSAQTATVRLTPGEEPARVGFPLIDADVDWQTGLVRGTGPANREIYLGAAVPCAQQQSPGGLEVTVTVLFPTMTDEDGRFTAPIPPAARGPGAGLEVATYADSDHRVFRHFVRPHVRAFLGSDRVAGRVTSGTTVSMTLRSDDEIAGRSNVVAGPDGSFDTRLDRADGQPPTLGAGDRLMVDVGGEPIAITLEPLDFDWSPGSGAGGVQGTAPAGRSLTLALRLRSGQVVSLQRATDDEGRFSFESVDVPPRADWSLDDVVGVRATLTMAGGHQVIRQTESFESGMPPGDGRTIYLPVALKNATALGSGSGLAGRGLGPASHASPGLSWIVSGGLDIVRPVASGRHDVRSPVGRTADAARPTIDRVPWMGGTVPNR